MSWAASASWLAFVRQSRVCTPVLCRAESAQQHRAEPTKQSLRSSTVHMVWREQVAVEAGYAALAALDIHHGSVSSVAPSWNHEVVQLELQACSCLQSLMLPFYAQNEAGIQVCMHVAYANALASSTVPCHASSHSAGVQLDAFHTGSIWQHLAMTVKRQAPPGASIMWNSVCNCM